MIIHVVQPDATWRNLLQPWDTLWDISERYEQNGNKWSLIYNRNRQIIDINPDIIDQGPILQY
jgi:nucleoid-associated protein YgaU